MARSATNSTKKSKKAKKNKPARVAYHRRPADLQLDLWQLGLRKQFGEENDFHVTNTGPNPVFSEFIVWNPASRNSYTVLLNADLPKKGLPPENTLTRIGNSCTCQDFKTNRLGLCKHISAVEKRLELFLEYLAKAFEKIQDQKLESRRDIAAAYRAESEKNFALFMGCVSYKDKNKQDQSLAKEIFRKLIFDKLGSKKIDRATIREFLELIK